MIRKLKNKKVHITIAVGALAVGIMAFNVAGPKEAKLHIDSISPIQGPEGTLVTLSGSGFATNTDNANPISKKEDKDRGSKSNNNKKDALAPGNYLKIEGKIIGLGVFSADGTTLQFKLDLNNTKAAKECTKKLNKEKDCKIGLKIMTGDGKESNEVHFTVTPSTQDASFTPTPILSSFATYYHALPRTLEYQTVFTFDANKLAEVQSFRIYKKTPASSAFTMVASFANPSSSLPTDPTVSGRAITSSFGNWQLAWYPDGWWHATSETYLPPSEYPNGEYDFYVTAVDSAGIERTPSLTMILNVVGRATITNPTTDQVTSSTPTVTYKVINSVPAIVNYNVRAFSVSPITWWDPTGAFGFHDLVGGALRTVNPATQTEDSFTFSFSPTDSSDTPVVPAGKSYYIEAEGGVGGFQGQPVYVVLPDGVNFTVAK